MSSEPKETEHLEMDEEIAVKEKLNPSPDSSSPSKVKFTASKDGKNGEAKVDVDNGYGGSVGMSKEELMKYANDPFWVRLRMFLFIMFWVLWFAMLIGAVVIIIVAPKCPATSSLPWWQKTTIYQVYVRSFKDSNNDGEGDIKGLMSRLDYFKDIGIETLILSPIYPSKMADSGYDVTNYTDIDPRFGSLEDFDSLVEEMHKEDRKMKVILDFIPNHTSESHPWFTASRSGDPKYKDFYVWRNGTPNQPPNNWKSVFGGSAWTWSPERNQYYLHQFLASQPDLNLRNPEVVEALKEVLVFWLKHKVDGIRIDAVSHLFEDKDFGDEEVVMKKPVGNDYDTLRHNKTKAQEENFGLLSEWRKVVKGTGLKKILISEAYEPTDQLLRYYLLNNEPLIDLPFNFNLIDVNLNTNANQLKDMIESWLKAIKGLSWPDGIKPRGPWTAFVTGNHDKPRLVNRLGHRLSDAMLMLAFTLPRNTPVVYYGDEIGMKDNPNLPTNALREGDYSRFGQRSPMQWNTNTSSAGFSDSEGVQTWLNVPNSYQEYNVETELKNNKTSHLKVFKALVDLRKQGSESIILGETNFPNISITDNVFVMSRTSEGQDGYLLAINLNSALRKEIKLKEPYLPEKGTIYLTDSESYDDMIGKEVLMAGFLLQPSQSLLIKFSAKE